MTEADAARVISALLEAKPEPTTNVTLGQALLSIASSMIRIADAAQNNEARFELLLQELQARRQ